VNYFNMPDLVGARGSSWLRHYATSRKVMGSILDVIAFFS
jgi:hypothetical protein